MTDTIAAPAPVATTEAAPQNAGQTPAGGAQTGDVKSAAQEAMRKYKVKVEGQELEVDEKELLRGYSHQKAASKALNEGKALRKQAEEFVAMLKDKDKLKDVLVKLGHDPRRLSEEILSAHLEDELMDPKDKQLRDITSKLKHLEDMDKRQKEAVQTQRLEEMKTRFMKEYETDFVQALQESKLPPTKPMVAEMARYISRAAKIGFKMSAQEAAKLVAEDVRSAHERLIGDSDGETLLKLLGDEVANKIRKVDTSRLKNPEAGLQTPEKSLEPRERRHSPQKRMSTREWQLHKRGLR